MSALRGWIVGAFVLLAGCTAATGAPAPRDIAVGVDACDYCHMTADDPDRAAQWVEAGGRARVFDEPGCLVAWLGRNPGAQGVAFFADAAGAGWIAADSAHFVRGAAPTGMGFNILAYRSAQQAAAVAQQKSGVVQSWSELRKQGVQDAHTH